MTWSLNEPCPYCGHRAAIHSGPEGAEPGRCHAGAVLDCSCPGWHPLIANPPEQLGLFEPAVPDWDDQELDHDLPDLRNQWRK